MQTKMVDIRRVRPGDRIRWLKRDRFPWEPLFATVAEVGPVETCPWTGGKFRNIALAHGATIKVFLHPYGGSKQFTKLEVAL